MASPTTPADTAETPTVEEGLLVEEDLLVEEPLVEEELLIEEISIDGMCGVY